MNKFFLSLNKFCTILIITFLFFNSADGVLAIGTWNIATSLPTGIYCHTSVVANGYVYIIGGYNNSNAALNTVYYAPVNPDGTVGLWATTTSLPVGTACHSSVVANGYLYVMGGVSATSGADNRIVYYAHINTDGTVGTWSTTNSLPVNLYGQSSVVANGYVYSMGGVSYSSSGIGPAGDQVYYAPLNANGTIGTWLITTSLLARFYNSSSVVYNGYVYTTGGNASNNRIVLRAPLNANGTIGTWSNATNFPTAVYDEGFIIANGYVYVMGGYSGTAPVSITQYSTIDVNGTIGTWLSTTSPGLAQQSSVVANGFIYEIGGYNGSSASSRTYYSTVATQTPCSATNSCNQTNSGFLQSDGTCSATPPPNPLGYGSSCISPANACGQTTSGGTIQCDGTCSLKTAPAVTPTNYGNACSATVNSCGQLPTPDPGGTIQCNSACSSSIPDSNCSVPPTISSITPSQTTTGSGDVKITVNGDNFINSTYSNKSVVNWDNSTLATVFNSIHQLVATIPSSVFTAPYVYPITVTNTNVGPSNQLPFIVKNPIPVISSISPTSTPQNSPSFTLDVYGSNFITSSVVYFNSSKEVTTYISSTHLQATIPSGDVGSVGNFGVVVKN